MLRYAAGDASAFEDLFNRYRRKIFGFVYGYLKNRQAAEDVFQEVFLRVIRASPGYAPSARFSTWVFTIARNVCIDHHRRSRGLKLVSINDGGPQGEEGGTLEAVLASDSPGALDLFTRQEAAARVERALQGIKAEQKEVFLLRQEGISFEEIASIVGAGTNTVKSRMRYALEGVRKALAAEEQRA